jgi:hypothetical protein
MVNQMCFCLLDGCWSWHCQGLGLHVLVLANVRDTSQKFARFLLTFYPKISSNGFGRLLPNLVSFFGWPELPNSVIRVTQITK